MIHRHREYLSNLYLHVRISANIGNHPKSANKKLINPRCNLTEITYVANNYLLPEVHTSKTGEEAVAAFLSKKLTPNSDRNSS